MATWLTVAQVAEYLQLSRAKVYELARAGTIPAARVGNQWRFDQEKVDEWLRAQGTSGSAGW
jgi:excisionase family DNA binding protein